MLADWGNYGIFVTINLTHIVPQSWTVELDECVEGGVNDALGPEYSTRSYTAKVMFVAPQCAEATPFHVVYVRFPFWSDSLSQTAPVVNTLSDNALLQHQIARSCADSLSLGSVSASVFRKNETSVAYELVDLSQYQFPSSGI